MIFGRREQVNIELDQPTSEQLLSDPQRPVGAVALYGSTEEFPGLNVLRPELDRLTDAWSAVHQIVDDYMYDPLNTVALTELIVESHARVHATDDRCRQHSQAEAQRNLSAFASVAFLRARFNYKKLTDRIMHNDDKIDATTAAHEQLIMMREKWKSIKGEAHPRSRPATAAFIGTTEKLEKRLKKPFAQADKTFSRVGDELASRYLDGTAHDAETLIKGSERLVTSEDPHAQILLTVLATDFVDEGSASIIEKALAKVDVAALDGDFLLNAFLKQNSHLQGDPSQWSDMIYAKYQKFIDTYLTRLRTSVTRQVVPFIDRSLISPTPYEVGAALDKVGKIFIGSPVIPAQPSILDRYRPQNFRFYEFGSPKELLPRKQKP